MPLFSVSEGAAVLASSHTSVLTKKKPLQRTAPDAHEGDHLSGTGAASGGGGPETADLWDWDSFK